MGLRGAWKIKLARIAFSALVSWLAFSIPSGALEHARIKPRWSLEEACRVWQSHMADLIDQHRTASEMEDEQFGDVVRRFYEAQTACTAEHFNEGLALYENIPVGPVKGRPLR